MVVDPPLQDSLIVEKATGWSVPETWGGTWSDGSVATLTLRSFDETMSDIAIAATAHAFLTPQNPEQKIDIFANGTQIGHWEFGSGDAVVQRKLMVPANLFTDRSIHLEFRFRNAVSPKAGGIPGSGDKRVLAIGMHEMRLSPSHD
jgi:hypothetical protein